MVFGSLLYGAVRTLKGAEHVEVDQTGYKLRHQKKKNHNQDTAMATLLHAGEENEPLLLVGVYDGHGVDGHQASRVAARGVSSSFVAAAMEGTSWGPALTLGCYAAEVKMRDELPAAAFHSSGTTAIIAAVGGTSGRCVLANLGDSRGVKLSAAVAPGGDPRDESAGWRVALETADHKPEAAVERARIEEAGGCVYWPPMFKKGVGRVCTKATATTIDAVHAGQMTMAEVHGKIAMMAISRTIGDDHFTACGVTSEPEIYETTIEEADRALVLATDGLWDCVSSAEVAEIAHAHRHSALAAAEALERVAALRAAKADGYRDDITVAVIFLPLRSLSAADGAAGFAAPEPHADPTEAPQRWPVRAKSDLVLVEDMMEDGLSEASVVDASRLSADNGKPSQSWFSPTSTMDC